MLGKLFLSFFYYGPGACRGPRWFPPGNDALLPAFQLLLPEKRSCDKAARCRWGGYCSPSSQGLRAPGVCLTYSFWLSTRTSTIALMRVQRARSCWFQEQFSRVLIKTPRLSYLPIASSTAHSYLLSFRKPNAEMNLYQVPPVSHLGGCSLFVAQRLKYIPKTWAIQRGFAWRGVLKHLLTWSIIWSYFYQVRAWRVVFVWCFHTAGAWVIHKSCL